MGQSLRALPLFAALALLRECACKALSPLQLRPVESPAEAAAPKLPISSVRQYREGGVVSSDSVSG
jgi:hypothetical protein